jgi:hypothetical protein
MVKEKQVAIKLIVFSLNEKHYLFVLPPDALAPIQIIPIKEPLMQDKPPIQ